MSFALAVAVVAVLGLVIVGVRAGASKPVMEDEPPSTAGSSLSRSRQVLAVTVAAVLRDEDSLIVAFAPPAAEVLSRLPGREWGTVVVERPRSETVRMLEAWRQGREQLVMVAETPPDEQPRQVSLEAPDGPTLVLSA
jgi:hypothetical protein